MQLVTIECREVAGRPGVITAGGEILDLAAAPTTLDQAQWIPPSVVSILAAGEEGRERVQRLLDSAAEADPQQLREAGVLLPTDQTRLMAPVRRPGLVLILESDRAALGEPDPVAYIKSPNTVVGPATMVTVPWRAAQGLSARPLLGAVLGRPLHLAGTEDAAAAIAAYTLLLDLSRPHPEGAVDAAGWRAYQDSKQFPGACPIGPALVTADELAGESGLTIVLAVNGVEGTRIDHDLLDVPATLAGLSQRFGFRPGDVIGFDLPLGAEDQREYRDGDTVAVEFEGCMRLETRLRF
ncbi:MAG: fumarylacetoacetate hydrolase family protein [Chromatiales bacterium]|nr:MAG: fumarylacetoacetate hydrolase family protein [Chromatiales bacterium]